MHSLPNDIRRLFFFELIPKAFLVVATDSIGRLCLEPRYMRVKQEWSRYVFNKGSWDFHMVITQNLPDGTIDGTKYVYYRGICIDEKSQWKHGACHGVSYSYYDDKPAYCFFVNGRREGLCREWDYDRNRFDDDTPFYPEKPSDYFLTYEALFVNNQFIWHKSYDTTGRIIATQDGPLHQE